ncbi:insulin-like growth factor 1 receptor isoform X2 [Anneissia japonica]|uniref:insulin-like growth factor 1 receptor isoform X2 n=1 Tax=Anneissia japonica TaxID=1529436 RepID=UPI001425584A|nr:insulin-like growth factor 1 receptor isoform X2 [Anneissia japonica]
MRGSNWCAFFGLQYGSVYQIKIYVSVVADNVRGNYIDDIRNSPDCYDETESIPFCLTQPVEYIGKPFNITTDFKRIDGTNDVTVYVTWQQPIHANPDTPLIFYTITWDSDNAGGDSFDFKNFTYEPAGFLTTSLLNPLQEDKNYNLTITAVVLDGDKQRFRSAEVSFSTYLLEIAAHTDDVSIYIIAGGIVGLFLFIFLVAILHRKAKRDQRDLRIFIPTDFQQETDAATKALADYPQYEIHRDDITWEKRIMLGSGHYGEVYKCKVQIMEESVDAAVKVPKQMAIGKELEDFVEEIKQIIKLGTHENVVRFLGYNTSSNPLMMINEFVQYGDMYSFLRKIKNKKAPKDDPIYNIERINQLEIAMQIAEGMAYISSKRFLHGDLAARNILIDKGLVVKITDFGLSHDIYERNYRRMKTDEALPWRWQAIETFTERKMSSKSDVWSFGVVLSEIFKFCDPPPYHTLPSEDLVNFLKLGKRMERPPDCPQYMYQIMMRCWDVDPSRRPTFNDLLYELKGQVGLHSSSMIPGENGNANLCKLYKPKRSHGLTDTGTSGSSFAGVEFIREPGSEESGTGGKEKKPEGPHALTDTSGSSLFDGIEFIREPDSEESGTGGKEKVTREHCSPDGNLRHRNSYVNYAFEDSVPIDDFELSGRRIVADSTSNEMEENADSLQLSTGRPNSNAVHEDFGFSAFDKEKTTGSSSTTTTGEYFISGEFIRETEDSGLTNESYEEQSI